MVAYGVRFINHSKPAYKTETKKHIQITFDEREIKINSLFKKYNSPLEARASSFIDASEHYHIDYKILVAISGIESRFGTSSLCGQYNPFGYGNPCWDFRNFDEAIWQVAKTIGTATAYKTYRDSNRLEELARVYNQQDTDNWIKSVGYFKKEVE